MEFSRKIEEGLSVSMCGLAVLKMGFQKSVELIPVVISPLAEQAKTLSSRIPGFGGENFGLNLFVQETNKKYEDYLSHEQALSNLENMTTLHHQKMHEQAKATLRDAKAEEAKQANILSLKDEIIEVSPPLEYLSFDHAVQERSLGQFAVTQATEK